MNKKRAIEIHRTLKNYFEKYFTDEERSYLGEELTDLEIIQALDIAIESLIKQSEYNMHTHNVEFQLKLAEKKLNELGYAFNEYRGCIIAIDKADKE